MCIFCQQRPKSGTATQDDTLFSRTSEAKLFQFAKLHFSAAHRQDTKKDYLWQYPERIIRLFLFFEAKTELVKPSNEPPKALPTPKLRIITIFSFHPTKRLKEANTELMKSSNIFPLNRPRAANCQTPAIINRLNIADSETQTPKYAIFCPLTKKQIMTPKTL